MQSIAIRSGRCAASRAAAASASSAGALGRSASAAISIPGRCHFFDSLPICSGAGTRRPRRPVGRSAAASPARMRDGNTTPASPRIGGKAPVQAKSSASAPSRRRASRVTGARSITAAFEILTSRRAAQARVERVVAVSRRQRIDLGVPQAIETAAHHDARVRRQRRGEDRRDIVARRLADDGDAERRHHASLRMAASCASQRRPTPAPFRRSAPVPGLPSLTRRRRPSPSITL